MHQAALTGGFHDSACMRVQTSVRTCGTWDKIRLLLSPHLASAWHARSMRNAVRQSTKIIVDAVDDCLCPSVLRFYDAD